MSQEKQLWTSGRNRPKSRPKLLEAAAGFPAGRRRRGYCVAQEERKRFQARPHPDALFTFPLHQFEEFAQSTQFPPSTGCTPNAQKETALFTWSLSRVIHLFRLLGDPLLGDPGLDRLKEGSRITSQAVYGQRMGNRNSRDRTFSDIEYLSWFPWWLRVLIPLTTLSCLFHVFFNFLPCCFSHGPRVLAV